MRRSLVGTALSVSIVSLLGIAAMCAPASAAAPAATANQTFAGYRLDQGPAKTVTGDWIVPTLTCDAKQDTGMRTFFRLSKGSKRLEVGVVATCREGVASYHGYLSQDGRRYPQGSKVDGGDAMDVYMDDFKGSWEIDLTDDTAGWGVGTGVESTGGATLTVLTAGVAVYAQGAHALPLASFDTAPFSDIVVNGRNLDTRPARRLQLRDANGTLLVSVSGLSSPGSFTATCQG